MEEHVLRDCRTGGRIRVHSRELISERGASGGCTRGAGRRQFSGRRRQGVGCSDHRFCDSGEEDCNPGAIPFRRLESVARKVRLVGILADRQVSAVAKRFPRGKSAI